MSGIRHDDMNVGELKTNLEAFYAEVRAYRDLLGRSRGHIFPDIEKNHEEIADTQRKLLRAFAKLEPYIKRFGGNPKMNDGVWNVTYSPYANAFTNDILERVGPSVDAVLNDLDLIIGRLEEKESVQIVEGELDAGSQIPAGDDVSRMTDEQLETIVVSAENTNIPGSRFQRAKLELDLRERRHRVADGKPVIHQEFYGNVQNAGAIQTDNAAKVKLFMTPNGVANKKPWYRAWWMNYIVYPLFVGLLLLWAT